MLRRGTEQNESSSREWNVLLETNRLKIVLTLLRTEGVGEGKSGRRCLQHLAWALHHRGLLKDSGKGK